MRKASFALLTGAFAASLAGSAMAQAEPATTQSTPRKQPAAVAQMKPAPMAARQSSQQLPAPVPPAASNAQVLRGTLTAQQRALVERINGYLTSVHTLVGDFVQVGPDGSRTEGKFYLQKPGRIRFEYNSPSPIEMIADGRSVAIRDRRLATQDLLLLSQTPLRFLLSEKIDLTKEGNLVSVQADDTFISVVLEEKNALAGTHRLMLMFGAQDAQLKQWTVTDPQGYDTTVALYNVDSSKKPDPNLFTINYEKFRD
jgi:outer membrane lipoprotein-sorting protein